MKIEFLGYHLFLKTYKSNRDSFSIEIETGRDQFEKIKDIPLLAEGVYRIIVEPEIEKQ